MPLKSDCNLLCVHNSWHLMWIVPPSIRGLLSPRSVVSLVLWSSSAEKAAPCSHPQRKGRPFLVQWHRCHRVRCYRLPGAIRGQSAGWVEREIDSFPSVKCNIKAKKKTKFFFSPLYYIGIQTLLLYWSFLTVTHNWLGVLFVCRSDWLSDRSPSSLRSVWHYVFQAYGGPWTNHFYGE